jgi:hypothetical protein
MWLDLREELGCGRGCDIFYDDRGLCVCIDVITRLLPRLVDPWRPGLDMLTSQRCVRVSSNFIPIEQNQDNAYR